MTDSTLNRFLASGTNAERLAFTPVPPTPGSGPDPMYIWTETDTNDVFVWDPTNTTWIQINVAGTAASTTEVLTGTNTTKFVSPDALAALWEKGSDEASAGTVSIGEGGFFHVTGTTTITDIDFDTDKAGRACILMFEGALTLTHNATSLILPTGANITTAAGDCCLVVSEGGDNVRVVWYMRKDGTPLAGGSSSINAFYPTFTTPVDGDFAWINQGGAAVTVNANGGIHLRAPANSGHSIRLRKKAAPATPYTITAAFIVALPSFDFCGAGLAFRQSSDGKIITMQITAGNGFADMLLECSDYTNATTFSASNATLAFFSTSSLIWLRIADNGTDRIVSWSMDGYNFEQLLSEGRTTFLTADEIGFFSDAASASAPVSSTLLSWAQT